MAIPDRIRKSHVMTPTVSIPAAAPVRNTSSQENSSTTAVRIAVARVESVFLMPIFAKIAVIPANKASHKPDPATDDQVLSLPQKAKKRRRIFHPPLVYAQWYFYQTNMMDTGLSS